MTGLRRLAYATLLGAALFGTAAQAQTAFTVVRHGAIRSYHLPALQRMMTTAPGTERPQQAELTATAIQNGARQLVQPDGDAAADLDGGIIQVRAPADQQAVVEAYLRTQDAILAKPVTVGVTALYLVVKDEVERDAALQRLTGRLSADPSDRHSDHETFVGEVEDTDWLRYRLRRLGPGYLFPAVSATTASGVTASVALPDCAPKALPPSTQPFVELAADSPGCKPATWGVTPFADGRRLRLAWQGPDAAHGEATLAPGRSALFVRTLDMAFGDGQALAILLLQPQADAP